MNIKKKFFLITCLLLFWIILLSLVMIYISFALNGEIRKIDITHRLNEDIFDTVMLANDYFLHPEQRQLIQLAKINGSIIGVFRESSAIFAAGEEMHLYESIANEYSLLNNYISAFVDPGISYDLKASLQASIFIKSQEIVSEITELSEAVGRDLILKRKIVNVLFVLIILTAISIILSISRLAGAQISAPIQYLAKSVSSFRGNTAVKFDPEFKSRDDEIGNLTQAFDSMQNQIILEQNMLSESNKKIRAASKQLKDALARLEEVDAFKTHFMNICAHELRTPLIPIFGYVDLILRGKQGSLSRKQRKSLQTILQSSERLSKVVEKIFDVAKLEGGMMEFNFEKTDMTVIIDDVCNEFAKVAEQKGVKLICPQDTNLPLVYADQSKVKRVMQILIDNAIKFTEIGSITVSARKFGNKIELSVKDTGIGIRRADISG